MGMFDDVNCEVPLPDGWDGQGMQTKDFGCSMATITITKDGRLFSDQRDWWRKDEAEPCDLQFHGDFRFYGSEGRYATPGYRWHEYIARFTEGQLVRITLVSACDSGSDPKGEAGTAECEASQSGGEAASPNV